MHSLICNSMNFNNVEKIATDLIEGLDKKFSNNAIGFLSCDSRIDSAKLIAILHRELAFPVVGGTTLTLPLAENEDEISASMTVIEKDKVHYHIAITDTLKEEISDQQMEQLYEECITGLDGEPRLLMPFIPRISGMMTDKFISSLFRKAGKIPVFGGLTTDDLETTKAAVLANGEAYSDRMVLVAIGGAIRPVFSVGSQLTIMSEYAPSVTESDSNIVKKVDDMTFCEYMKQIGIAPEDRVNGVDALVQYGPLPVRLRNKLDDDDGIPEIRCISYTNIQEGSVAFSSNLPVGTRVNIGIIDKSDVTESSKNCLTDLLDKIEQNEKETYKDENYKYGVLFCLPCVARYFAMVGGENLESKYLRNEIPKTLVTSSYYAFCEIGPTQGKEGEIHNRSHNASIVMCAI